MTQIVHRAAYLRAKPAPEARRASFVAATEAAIDTGYGPEVLRMSGCDLSAYRQNPVVLDSHRRESSATSSARASSRSRAASCMWT